MGKQKPDPQKTDEPEAAEVASPAPLPQSVKCILIRGTYSQWEGEGDKKSLVSYYAADRPPLRLDRAIYLKNFKLGRVERYESPLD